MTPRSVLRLKPILATVISALACSACFGGAPPGATSADGRPVLDVAMPWPPVQAWSPYGDDGTILSRLGVTESLTRLDEAGSPEPALATAWRRTADRVWELDLRSDVRFHDGSRLTASAVSGSLRSAAAATPVPAGLDEVGLSAAPVDADTVRVRTRVPDPALPQRLSSPHLPILSAASLPAADAGPRERVDPRGAATGPFVLDETSGVVGAKLSAHDGYWDGRPRLGGLDVRFLPEASSRVAAFGAGEVDVANTISVADLATVGDRTVEVPLPRSVLVYLNAGSTALDSRGERATVAEAVDPELIASSIFEDRVDPASGIFGPATSWARGAVAERTPATGTPIDRPLTLATYSERPELPQVADAVAAALREQGVRVTQVVRSYASLEPDLLAGKFDLVVGSRSYAVDTGEPVDYLLSDFGCRGSYNLAQVCDPEVEAALRRLVRADEPSDRREAALAAERTVLDTGAVVPVVHERARHAVSDGVSGLAVDPYERRFVTAETTLS